MKKLIVVVMAIAIIAMAGVAMAGDTANVTVNATVVGNCKFNSGGTVVFTLDPAAVGDVNGIVLQPAFWCTRNATYGITDDNGMHESGVIHRMLHATLTEYIPYSFTYTSTGTGTGKTSPITMDIASTIVNADYINASAGSYADTVVLSITP